MGATASSELASDPQFAEFTSNIRKQVNISRSPSLSVTGDEQHRVRTESSGSLAGVSTDEKEDGGSTASSTGGSTDNADESKPQRRRGMSGSHVRRVTLNNLKSHFETKYKGGNAATKRPSVDHGNRDAKSVRDFKLRLSFWNEFELVVGKSAARQHEEGQGRERSDTVSQASIAEDEKEDEELSEEQLRAIREAKRAKVIEEIQFSERLYCKFLTIMVEKYIKPLRPILDPEHMVNIFSSIETIAPFHEIVAFELSQTEMVAPVFAKYASYLKMYKPYVNNYEKAVDTVMALKDKNSKFAVFLNKRRRDPSCGGLDIMSFLIMPIQRIPRYRLLLEQLRKYTPSDSDELAVMDEALAKVKEIADEVNESKRKMEHLRKMAEVQQRISGDYNIIAPHRYLIREAALVRKQRSSKDIHFFLFNDICMWTSAAPAYHFKGVVELAISSVFEFVHKERVGFTVSSPALKEELHCVCKSAKERDSWIELLQKTMDEAAAARKDRKSRLHLRRNDVHGRIQSSLKNLSGTLKKKLEEAKAGGGDNEEYNNEE